MDLYTLHWNKGDVIFWGNLVLPHLAWFKLQSRFRPASESACIYLIMGFSQWGYIDDDDEVDQDIYCVKDR